MIESQTLNEYLEQLASDAPTPGGGAVAAVTAAQATGLLAMVARLTKSTELEFGKFAELMDAKRKEMMKLANDDMTAFQSVMAAYGLKKDDPDRTPKLQSALKSAADAPLKLAKVCWSVMETSQPYIDKSNPNVMSDAVIAIHLFLAAIAASATNVRINLKYIKDDAFCSDYEEQLQNIEESLGTRAEKTLDRLYRRLDQA